MRWGGDGVAAVYFCLAAPLFLPPSDPIPTSTSERPRQIDKGGPKPKAGCPPPLFSSFLPPCPMGRAMKGEVWAFGHPPPAYQLIVRDTQVDTQVDIASGGRPTNRRRRPSPLPTLSFFPLNLNTYIWCGRPSSPSLSLSLCWLEETSLFRRPLPPPSTLSLFSSCVLCMSPLSVKNTPACNVL